MRKLKKDLTYILRTNGQQSADMLESIHPCCDIMSEWLRRENFSVENDNVKFADISFHSKEMYGIKHCPWCAAKVIREYNLIKKGN
jgi:hypothetical protein